MTTRELSHSLKGRLQSDVAKDDKEDKEVTNKVNGSPDMEVIRRKTLDVHSSWKKT